MNGKHQLSLIASVVACTFAHTAQGVQQPEHLPAAPELADGSLMRGTRTVGHHVPPSALRAWRAFQADVGGRWVASWDDATKVPSRIFGTGIQAPGTVAFADAAEIFARTFLERHLELLAPGALPGDFELASNVVHGGQRVVAFVQKAAGLRVLGGQLSFRFKNDRLFVIASQALPNVHVTPRPLTLSEADLQMEAEHWIGMDYGADALASDVTGPFVLPIVRDGYVADYRIVMRVTVDTRAMVSRWAVFLDADSGVPVAREQLLRFATGTVMYNVPVRRPTDVRADYPARSATLLVDAVSATTDDNGVLTFADGAPVQVASALAGPLVSVNNDAGPNASTIFTLDPGGTIVWNAANEPEIDAQLTSFIHARIAKDHGLGLAPDLSGFIDNLLPVNVNISDLCNAFYDGQAINFFQEGGPCENT
ncbi:MAG TPA: hypothetical protein VFB62_22625, partial [Polyangiaceae bacterium]|nr:hypothetical protein [Polyangiaceae bacterium]